MENIKEWILFYTSHFYLADFMLILLVFLFFTCILFLCIFLSHKPIIALFIIALDIIASFLIYIYGYRFIDFELRSRITTIQNQKIIQSSGAFIVDFNITNTSKFNFKDCKVTAKLYQNPNENDNFISSFKKQFIAFRQKSKSFNNLEKGSTQFQRIAFDNFDKEGNYTLRLSSECF
ncbi:DUF2393 family protein [Campylobacter upsaliensis]|uniref:DUF2393 family protein n=1 Tax=Campylobacter upsaliensis TaxID=28080 RepID=UPI0022EAD629|nr:DUF2393 family protein [Campylobacter upsaliensis]